MADQTISAAHLAARVIPAIGRSDFPDRLISVIRDLTGCDLTPAQVAQRMEDAGPTLIAALRRHTELMERAAQTVTSPSRSVLLQRAREWGLSAREAQVAAGLATGQSQSDIAKGSGVTLNSVITYRRRAYQKLKVADRFELQALCERLLARGESPGEP